VFITIAIGELHVGLTSDIRVIISSKQLNLEDLVEADWPLVLGSTNPSQGD
jgi:hypothetical protein